MKCVICHGDDIRISDVREEFHLENDIVYVPIQVPVCQGCGERYYDRRTMRLLEEAEERLKAGKASVRAVGRVLVCE